jgi:hypothetical protein
VQHFNGVVRSTLLDLPIKCGICMHNIQQVVEEDKEEDDTPHIDT